MVKPVPEGYHAVTPYLIVSDAGKAIEFYKRGLGAQEIMRMPGPGGRIMHAEVKIGDSIVMLGEEPPDKPTFRAPGGRAPDRPPVTLPGQPPHGPPTGRPRGGQGGAAGDRYVLGRPHRADR